MADRTKIEWADATLNSIKGCTPVSDACKNCCALRMARMCARMHTGRYDEVIDTKTGQWNGNVIFDREALKVIDYWKKPRRIFHNLMGDTFHEKSRPEWFIELYRLAEQTPQHTHIFLTKRPENLIRFYFGEGGIVEYRWKSFPLQNVWIGTTIETQAHILRLKNLSEIPAAVRFVSAEPLLGPLNFGDSIHLLGWVIVGGESGSGARPTNPEWVRSLRDQCEQYNVPFLFKQWGEWLPDNLCMNHWPKKGKGILLEGGANMIRMGRSRAAKLGIHNMLYGRTHLEYPA